MALEFRKIVFDHRTNLPLQVEVGILRAKSDDYNQ